MKTEMLSIVHTCDGCGKEQVQLAGRDAPDGFFLRVTVIDNTGGEQGELYVCRERCLAAAFRNRADHWNEDNA